MRRTLVWTILVSSVLAGGPAFAQDMGHMQMTPAPTPPAQQTTPPTPPARQPTEPSMPMDHGGTDHPMQMDDHATGGESMSHDMSDMTGTLGLYPMARDASGTSWQPDASMHMGEMSMNGQWMVMTHAMYFVRRFAAQSS